MSTDKMSTDKMHVTPCMQNTEEAIANDAIDDNMFRLGSTNLKKISGHNSKIKNRKIDFSFDSAHCGYFIKTGVKLRGKGSAYPLLGNTRFRGRRPLKKASFCLLTNCLVGILSVDILSVDILSVDIMSHNRCRIVNARNQRRQSLVIGAMTAIAVAGYTWT